MILKAIVNDQTFPITIPDEMLTEAEKFFQRMNADMDKGWQMSRKWVDRPNARQRCQIAADRMLTAIETENSKMAALMAAYILKHMPGLEAIDIDTTGDMNATDLIMQSGTHN
jgi:hypothetical protein